MATSAAPIGIVVGIAAIVFGWVQSSAQSPVAAGTLTGRTQAGAAAAHPNGSIALVVIGVFLALTPSMAGMSLLLYRLNRFAAVPLSVLIAALSVFLNRLNANILGYKVGPEPSSAAIDNLMFYGTVLIFLAGAGRAPCIDFARPSAAREMTNEDVIGIIGCLAIVVVIWSSFVGWAQNQMGLAFLS